METALVLRRAHARVFALVSVGVLAIVAGPLLDRPFDRAAAQSNTAQGDSAGKQDRTQKRPAKVRVEVPIEKVRVDDGDTIDIDWGPGDTETVRILGIDTPETQHVPHNIPYDQPFGREALGFARGVFAATDKVEVLRADMMDPYGRSLAYVFVDGKNYSVLVVRAALAAESVSHYGDNGFPAEAQAVIDAAQSAGPLPFEPPFEYRQRMRKVSDWMKGKQEPRE